MNQPEHSKFVYVYMQFGIFYTKCKTFIPNYGPVISGDARYITLREHASRLRIYATVSWGCPTCAASPNSTSHQYGSQIFEAESRKEIYRCRIALSFLTQ